MTINITSKTISAFDEMQISNRNKYGFHSFLISAFLVIVNFVIKTTYGVWATPVTEGVCMFIIPFFYFTSRCIFSDAFLSNNKKIKAMYVLDFFVTGIFLTFYIIFANKTSVMSGGVLSDDFSIICLDLYTVLTGIICVSKNRSEVRKCK